MRPIGRNRRGADDGNRERSEQQSFQHGFSRGMAVVWGNTTVIGVVDMPSREFIALSSTPKLFNGFGRQHLDGTVVRRDLDAIEAHVQQPPGDARSIVPLRDDGPAE